jgi:serine/threonine protein kinase
MLKTFSTLRHPNVADVYKAYYHNNKFYVISEYLDLSLLNLNFTQYPLEEWEIATIVTEVETPVEICIYTKSF